MPEEPDLSTEDIEILDQNIRARIEAKTQLRQRKAEEISSVADRILAAVKSRPDDVHRADQDEGREAAGTPHKAAATATVNGVDPLVVIKQVKALAKVVGGMARLKEIVEAMVE